MSLIWWVFKEEDGYFDSDDDAAADRDGNAGNDHTNNNC